MQDTQKINGVHIDMSDLRVLNEMHELKILPTDYKKDKVVVRMDETRLGIFCYWANENDKGFGSFKIYDLYKNLESLSFLISCFKNVPGMQAIVKHEELVQSLEDILQANIIFETIRPLIKFR